MDDMAMSAAYREYVAVFWEQPILAYAGLVGAFGWLGALTMVVFTEAGADPATVRIVSDASVALMILYAGWPLVLPAIGVAANRWRGAA